MFASEVRLDFSAMTQGIHGAYWERRGLCTPAMRLERHLLANPQHQSWPGHSQEQKDNPACTFRE